MQYSQSMPVNRVPRLVEETKKRQSEFAFVKSSV